MSQLWVISASTLFSVLTNCPRILAENARRSWTSSLFLPQIRFGDKVKHFVFVLGVISEGFCFVFGYRNIGKQVGTVTWL